MDIHLNLLNAKKLLIHVDPEDTMKKLKQKIVDRTGIPSNMQVLRLSGKEILTETNLSKLKLGRCRSLTVEYSHEGKSGSFYLDVVTSTGGVHRVVLPCESSTVKDVKKHVSQLIKVAEENLFLRIVNMDRYMNKPLGEMQSTMEQCSLSQGSVLYVQIHPFCQTWYHGKITRDQAEEVLRLQDVKDGNFLVKESLHFPGDYVIFVCHRGAVKHIRIKCKKNMMFTLDETEFYDNVIELIEHYQLQKGNLPTKLTEIVTKALNGFMTDSRHDPPSPYKKGSVSPIRESSSRDRLQTESSFNSDTNVLVVLLDTKQQLVIPTNNYTTVYELKRLLQREKGIPADWQFLRLASSNGGSIGKPMSMNSFLLDDYHITEESTVLVQVHPWTEEWYVGKASAGEAENALQSSAEGFLVKESLTRPGTYALFIRCDDKVWQYKISWTDEMFTIDNNDCFPTLSDLVEHYKRNKGCLKRRLGTPVRIDERERNGYLMRDKSADDESLIPVEILARGQKARSAYNRALEKGRTRDSRVRIMLIGQDRVGKTSLKRSLKGEKFNLNEVSTNGVDIDRPVQHVGVGPWMEAAACAGRTEFDCKVAELVAKSLSKSDSVPDSPGKPSNNVTWCDSVFEEDSADGKGGRISTSMLTASKMASTREETKLKGISNANQPNGLVEPRSPLPSTSNRTRSSHIVDKLDPRPDPLQEVTDLVEGFLCEESKPVNGDVCPVFWDFAGQSVYHATHPLFMSPRAIYVLVWDVSRSIRAPAECRVRETGQEERVVDSGTRGLSTNLDHVTKWLSMVHFWHQSEPELSGQLSPPVVLVGTHADCADGDPLKSVESVLKAVQGKEFSGHVIPEQFVVNNTLAGSSIEDEDPVVQSLRQRLLSLAMDLPHTKKEVPLQWLHVEKVTDMLVDKGVKFVNKEEFKVISSTVCDFELEGDYDELLDFLHNRGTVVYFAGSIAGGDELVVLNPSWLVDLCSEIITVIPGKAEPLRIREFRRSLEQEGVLTMELVSFAFKKLNLKHAQETLLNIMERVGLVCEWPQRNSSQMVYLVPCMLTVRSESDVTQVTQSNQVEPLYLTFRGGYVPPGFFSRLLVHSARWCAAQWTPEQPKLFANAARFFVGRRNDISLVFVCHASVIKVCVLKESQPSPSREVMSICQAVRQFLDEALRTLWTECAWFRTVQPQLSMRCDLCRADEESGVEGCLLHHVQRCNHDDCAHFIPLVPSPLRCTRTFGKTTLLTAQAIRPWQKASEREAGNPISHVSYKTGQVSRDDLLSLANDIRDEWKALCGVLLDELEIDHIEHDERTLYDKCYRVLIRWTQTQASRATYGELAAALMHDGLRLDHLAMKYCVKT